MRLPVYEKAPFPFLAWHEGWLGDVVVPGLEPFASSDGTIELNLDAEDAGKTPSEAQARAFVRLVDGDEALAEAVLAAIVAEYPALQTMYGYDPETAAELMPPVQTAGDLEPLIELGCVHVLREEKNGEAYVGFSFGCTWDEEHGLGVMTHAGRVLEVGQADTSFCFPDEVWEARRAAGTLNPPPAPRPVPAAPPRPAARPPRRWWEFWKRG